MAVYFIGTIFNKIIVFLLLPIYTANFDPASYGDNDLSMTTVTMLASLLFMEVWTPLLRFSYDRAYAGGQTKDIYQCRFFIRALVFLFISPAVC